MFKRDRCVFWIKGFNIDKIISVDPGAYVDARGFLMRKYPSCQIRHFKYMYDPGGVGVDDYSLELMEVIQRSQDQVIQKILSHMEISREM